MSCGAASALQFDEQSFVVLGELLVGGFEELDIGITLIEGF
jgi:hypothetical protein